MEKCLYWILIVFIMLASCASKKTVQNIDERINVATDSTRKSNQYIANWIDTTSTKIVKGKITRVTFFDKARNREHKTESDETDETSDDDDSDQPPLNWPADEILKNLISGNISSIEITDFESGTKKSGLSVMKTDIKDSTGVVKNTEEERTSDVSVTPVDPYKWRWIVAVVILMGVFFFILWLKIGNK